MMWIGLEDGKCSVTTSMYPFREVGVGWWTHVAIRDMEWWMAMRRPALASVG